MSHFHLVGVGGIGMSGLAQLLVHQGHRVTGSDRGLGLSHNARVFDALTAQGVTLMPQDGSYGARAVPDVLVLSSAIEEDNPDVVKAPNGVRRAHRSEILAEAVNDLTRASIAVAGSCGKTTVTSWLAESLFRLGTDPMALSGGLVNSFATNGLAGNFRPGEGPFVFEADESDKSLLSYAPDYALILNAASDHFPRAEILEVFSEFLKNTKRAALIERNLLDELRPSSFSHLKIKTFGAEAGSDADWAFGQYERLGRSAMIRVNDQYRLHTPIPGRHVAANATAVLGALDLLDIRADRESITAAVEAFDGVWRRFNVLGETANGALVIDDYAHNVDKIVSCLDTARELDAEGRGVSAVFQPHGFGPLDLMREDLFQALENVLADHDEFIFLPVYYAGGTTSFSPKSEDLVADYLRRSNKSYRFLASKEDAAKHLLGATQTGRVIVVMGARDNSLAQWAASLVAVPHDQGGLRPRPGGQRSDVRGQQTK